MKNHYLESCIKARERFLRKAYMKGRAFNPCRVQRTPAETRAARVRIADRSAHKDN